MCQCANVCVSCLQQRPVSSPGPGGRLTPTLRLQLDSGRHLLRETLLHLRRTLAAPSKPHQPLHLRLLPPTPRPPPPTPGRAPPTRLSHSTPLAPLRRTLPPLRQAASCSPTPDGSLACLRPIRRYPIRPAPSPTLRLLQSLFLVRPGSRGYCRASLVFPAHARACGWRGRGPWVSEGALRRASTHLCAVMLLLQYVQISVLCEERYSSHAFC